MRRQSKVGRREEAPLTGRLLAFGLLVFLVGCGLAGPNSPTAVGGPPNLAGIWTYRQDGPASCNLPARFRSMTFPATFTSAGALSYNLRLSGVDPTSANTDGYFVWTGSAFDGFVIYLRTTSELVAFDVDHAQFTVSGNRMTATADAELQYISLDAGPIRGGDCTGTFTLTFTRG